MRLDEEWIRARLPKAYRNDPIDCLAYDYLDGLTVMQEGERGGDDVVVYRATDEDDLRYWELEQVCRFLEDKSRRAPKTWRYERSYAKDNQWYYVEHRNYDYNAIEDPRLRGFEHFLLLARYGLPRERWEQRVEEYVGLMNYWYDEPHWDYDRRLLRFVEISDSKEKDDRNDPVGEPRPGSVIRVED
jgi:hypothetical protein